MLAAAVLSRNARDVRLNAHTRREDGKNHRPHKRRSAKTDPYTIGLCITSLQKSPYFSTKQLIHSVLNGRTYSRPERRRPNLRPSFPATLKQFLHWTKDEREPHLDTIWKSARSLNGGRSGRSLHRFRWTAAFRAVSAESPEMHIRPDHFSDRHTDDVRPGNRLGNR
jgi:hypothetical protein